MANKPKFIPKRNVSGLEIIQVLQDTNIPESSTNIDASLLFKSPKVDEDFIDIEMAEGDTPEECYTNLTTPAYSCYDFRNYGGEKDTDVEIYFKSIINNENFDYLTNYNTSDIPFIQLMGDPNIVLNHINNSGIPYQGSVYNTIGEYVSKLLNIKVGCDFNDVPQEDINFKIEIYPFHGLDYDTTMSLYYEGDNKINNPVRWLGYIPGGILATNGIITLGGSLLAVINVNAFNALSNIILDMAGGPFDAIVATIDKLFPALNDAISSFYNPSTGYSTITATCGTVLAEALIAFGFLMGMLAITETIIRIVDPDAFVNNDINDGYKLYNITTGGVYNSFDVANSQVFITSGGKNDITSNIISGKASDIKIEVPEADIVDNCFFTGDSTENIFISFGDSTSETISDLIVYSNGIITTTNITLNTEQLIKDSGNIATISLSKNGLVPTNFIPKNGANYFIRFLVLNEDGLGTCDLENNDYINKIINSPINNTSSGTYELYIKSIDNLLSLNISLSPPFKGKIYGFELYDVPDEYPYNEFNTNGTIKNTKYLNFRFDPKGVKYDIITPPPATSYLVKLVPLGNSKLSTTKPTSFIVTCMPDSQPDLDFDVTPKEIYSNTLVTLKNAKYCDFVVFRDLKKTTLLGFFPNLYNFWINTNGSDGGATRGGSFANYNGSDISGINKKLIAKYQNYNDKEEYDVIFAMEKHSRCPELIFNRYFINRSVDNGFVNSIIPKYWELDNFYISGGACHKSEVGTGSIIQQMSDMEETINFDAMYRVRVEVTSHNGGLLYIDLNNTFVDGIYWISSGDMKNPLRFPLEFEPIEFEGNLNGAYISEDKCILPNTGIYDIALKAVSNSDLDKSIRILAGSDFIGSISYIHVRRMSYLKDLDKRVIPLALKKVKFRKGYYSQKIYLYFATYIDSPNITLSFGDVFNAFKPDEVGSPERKTIIDWGDGNIVEYPNIGEGIYGNVTHTYTDLSVKLYMITIYPSRGYEAIGYLQCNNKGLVHFRVNEVGLYNMELNLANCNLAYLDNYLEQLFQDGSLATNESQSIKIITSLKGAINIKLQNNTSLQCNINNLLGEIEYLDISNTNIYGDLKDLTDISEYFNISRTNINSYVGHPFTRCIYNEWENSKPIMDESSLNNLIRACYESAINNGTLFIGGNNPNITNEIVLSYINNLLERNWNIRFNSILVNLYCTITVNDITSSINIGSNISNLYINWGDGIINSEITHIYEIEGVYNIIYTNSIIISSIGISSNTSNYISNVDSSELINLIDINISNIKENEIVDLSDLLNLTTIVLSSSFYINLDITNSINSGILFIEKLTTNNLDNLLLTLDNNGLLEGSCNFENCDPPSEQGLIYVENLRNKGWTVLVDEVPIEYDIINLFTVIPEANTTIIFTIEGIIESIDWGDNIINTNLTHTYDTIGEYPINITLTKDSLSSINVEGCYLTTFYMNNCNNCISIIARNNNIYKFEIFSNINLSGILLNNNKIYGGQEDFTINNCPNLLYMNFENSGNIMELYPSGGLTTELVDYILTTLDNNGLENGELNLTVNFPPSSVGEIAQINLINKGWNVQSEYTPLPTITLGDKTYNSIQIGTQYWTNENLAFDDGLGDIYTYNNDEGNVTDYGRLYTWDAMQRISLLLADGWRIPTLIDSMALSTELGGNSVAGGKLKETGFDYWNSPNSGATNEVLFNGRGNGFRSDNTGYFSLKGVMYLWLNEDVNLTTGRWFGSTNTSDDISNGNTIGKNRACGIRLIKDV